MTVRVKTIAGLVEDVPLTASAVWPHFRFPFVGKGSPEQAQIAIQLLYRYRRVTTPVEQFGSLDFIGLDCNGFVGGYMQRVVEGKAWNRADINANPSPDSQISGLIHAKGLTTPIRSPDELRAEDTYLFGMCKPDGTVIDGAYAKEATATSAAAPEVAGHIVITEPGTLRSAAGGHTIEICEATESYGKKLRANAVCTIKRQTADEIKQSIFTIDRGPGGKVIQVKIVKLKVG